MTRVNLLWEVVAYWTAGFTVVFCVAAGVGQRRGTAAGVAATIIGAALLFALWLRL